MKSWNSYFVVVLIALVAGFAGGCVTDADPESTISRTPDVVNSTAFRSSATATSVVFTLSFIYPADTDFKVYILVDQVEPSKVVSATAEGTVLTLATTNGGALPTGKYYISAIEPGKTESPSRCEVTVGGVGVAATFNPQGGNWGGDTANKSVSIGSGVALGPYIPANPTRDGYTFWGWYTQANGNGTKISATTTMPSSSPTYFAYWGEAATFNPDGGNWSGNTANRVVYIGKGEALGTYIPAAPAKSGLHFQGWFTAANGGGTKISAATIMPSSAVTYYAYWTSEAVVTYNVTLGSFTASRATVSLSSAKVAEGDLVTITAKSNTGYRLSFTHTRTSGGGNSTNITTRSGANWVFTMPAYDVTVNVTTTAVSATTVMQNFTGGADGEMGNNLLVDSNNTTAGNGNWPTTVSERGYWNGFNAVGVTLWSNGTNEPSGSNITQFQASFRTEAGSTLTATPAVTRSLCLSTGLGASTTVANQRVGRTFHDGVKDYSGYNKISLYVRSMYPLNKYYFSLCTGGAFSKGAQPSESVTGTQYRYEFSVLDYQGKNGNDASIAYTWSSSITPKWMKVVIDIDKLAGPAGAPPLDLTQVSGWVFGFAGTGAYNNGSNADSVTGSGEALNYNHIGSNNMRRPDRTYLNWFVLEAVQ